MIAFESQHIIALLSHNLGGNVFLGVQGISRHHATGNIQPLQAGFAGTAVISLLFSSTASCPNTKRFSPAQALTKCNAPWPVAVSKERRRILPSTAITSPTECVCKDCVHATKQLSNDCGSRRANKRDGCPLGGYRDWGFRESGAAPSVRVTRPLNLLRNKCRGQMTRTLHEGLSWAVKAL